jgi:PAS domain S-box-containing protein
MLSELDQLILAQALEEMRAGRSGARQLELEGEEVVLTYAPLADFGWSLGLLSPLDELTAPAEATASAIRRDATETVRSTLTIMAAFFLLALISATSFNRRFLTRPVEALAAGTREVAGGNLKVRIPVESGDELGLLAGSFNHMTEELERSIDERQLAEALVREKEAQYRGIFEATSDGVVIRKLEDFTIVEANPAYCAMHGLEREEIIGTAIGGEGYRDHLKLIEAEGQFRLQGIDHRADGTPFHVEVLGTKIGYLGKPHLLVTVRDVSERVQAFEFLERRVAERTRELSTLLDISHSVTFTLELSRLLELILDKLRDVVDYAAAAIFILKDGELELLSYRGPLEGERPRPLEDTRHGREVIERRAPLVIADVHAETELARSLRLAALDGRGEVPGYIASWMGVPLIVRDKVIGILAFEHGERGYYDAHRAALALAFANQAAVAIENAQLYEEASGKAALEERQRLARELHDSVSQALYGIALGARTARTQLERDPKRAAEPLDYVLKLAEAAVAEMRALIFELRPESLAKEGLVTALDKQASALRARYGLKVETTLPEEPQLPFAAKEALYRVAQEALHNVVKHAGAKNADLALEVGGGRVSLTIADDGVGFDPSGDFPGHLGLKSMRERLESIGGCLYIESAPEEGTRLSASVPLG